jgi:hypothetical protein
MEPCFPNHGMGCLFLRQKKIGNERLREKPPPEREERETGMEEAGDQAGDY